ncbi:MAG: hypothetical protein QOE70_5868 [Chthoniobacter sp.]|jgi:hypothetical protein|nr:hypothetical protein [Chthoniobacter sp.]
MIYSALRLRCFLAGALAVGACASFAVTVEPGIGPDAAQLEFFEKSIRPVLADKCYKCHSAEADKSKGGLLLDTREGIRQGGDTGHAVVPGNLEESLLVQALRWHDKDLRMPPEKEGGKLPDQVIADFEKWVKMGAPDPRDGAAKVARKEIDIEKGRQFWAFQPPQAAPPPAVRNASWPRTDLDRFILAAQEAKGLKPNADADKRALLRRVYFDLIGLPPAPQDMESFLKDPAADALVKVVDRLLASPQFGERWGRHWLDAARYAESTGKERNFTFPTAWRYRDYVIAAFNADKPYDQFIHEQIAGDLLPGKDDAERDAHRIATGFLALGPKGLNEKNREQFRMDLIDEQIDATSRAILGVTVACARCHDHKFDPIPQREYYSLAGIFRSTETRFGTDALGGKNKNGTPLLSLSASGATATPAAVVSSPAIPPSAVKSDDKARLAALLASRPRQAKKLAALPPARQAEVLRRLQAQQGDLPARKPANKKKAAAPQKDNSAALAGQAMGVQEGTASNARLYVRGEIDSPGDTVPRGFLTVMTNGAPPVIPAQASGRLELADWLTANPLTARVMVNRAWQHLFGQGLVRTPDNFGATGERPSHPELLDALAVQFMRPAADGGMGWSVKKLVRSLVLSRTYALSSAVEEKAFATDPDNVLLWRATPRRLDAEAIRDAMLAASGKLELQPPQGSIVAKVGNGYIGKGIRPETFSAAAASYRSVYLPIVRDFVPDALEIFDFAEPSLVVAARDVTNVPSQALYLMNSDFVRAQADAMAARILAAPLDYSQRIALAYELALGRKPSEAERARTDQYLLDEGRALIPVKSGNSQEAAQLSWATFCQALFACAEFRYLK